LCRARANDDHHRSASSIFCGRNNAPNEWFALKNRELLGFPNRIEPPAASTTAATLIGLLCGLSAGGGCRGTNIRRHVSRRKPPTTTGQYSLNFGYNRERYFLGRLTTNVQAGRREQIVEATIEIQDTCSLSCAKISP
jgi:hypothetical protein